MEITVALYRRDPMSTNPDERKLYNYEAYHWDILTITPEGNYNACGATDRNLIDPETQRLENPNLVWWFYSRPKDDPSASEKYLGRIIIGTFPSDMTGEDIEAFFKQVPLPERGRNPQESCVTWVVNAIHRFHAIGCIYKFQVGEFLDWALKFADDRLWRPDERKEVVDYNEEMEKQLKSKKDGKK